MVTEQAFVFPLSSGQQRLWFLNQLEPNLPLYNIPIAHRFRGQLEVEALEQSLNGIIQHHEVLRTTFTMVDEQPVQVVHPTLTIQLPVIDLSIYALDEQEAEIERRRKEEAYLPFDLTSGPLLRAQILRTGPDESVFLLSVHHIVFDDWSIGLFYRELQTLYDAYKGGAAIALPELPIQYADYAVWQRKWQEQTAEGQLAYWKRQLQGAPLVLELPTDHPRPAVQTHRGAMYFFTLPTELLRAIKVLSQQEETTLFMTLLAAFQALLARYTGSDDIVVGSPIINRKQVEIESLIGFFVNTLVLRTDLGGNPTFLELLGRVRKTALEAYSHGDLPFEKLVDELQPRRDLSHTPLFQVLFALQTSSAALKLVDLDISPLTITNETAKFDLSLTITADKELTGVFEYSTDLFEQATIVHMVELFQTLLEGIIAGPEQRLADFPFVTDAERQKLLVAWNDTARDYPGDVCFHHLFEAQAEESPQAQAVVYEGQTLTYQELNARANQLAHYLQQLGVGPDVIVGICMKRSLEMVIGLLGVQKAGGTYVPLDPTYPKERLSFMLEDMQASILLTQQQLEPELPVQQARVICLDTDWQEIANQSSANPQSNVSTQNVAYMIYTSGSTGKPKGVMVTHGSLVNFLFSMREQLALGEQHTMLATTSLSFDIAGLELYLPLLSGMQVIVIAQETVADGKHLAAVIDTYEQPVMQMTPAAWQMLLETGWQGNPRLWLLCGGEALSADLARVLLTKGACLTNLYGPTETTIWSTLHRIESPDSTIPLGVPIANTQVYVLDSMMQPVAIGMSGEFYIGGRGLARGYFQRPDLTAEKFTPNPFSLEAGARLYRTGDLVRYRTDGSLEFLGRVDQQVKLHGFRIEPGEIESVLREHQAIRDAVVMIREDGAGEKRLVAYLIADRDATPSVTSVREHLRERLPVYMLPSSWIFLADFPLTPNGKVDRKSLPELDHHRPELSSTYVAPRRPIEDLLATIWAQILDIEQIGIYDNLFDLGGDSLSCVKITARVQQVGLSVTPKQLFQHQTIDRLVVALLAHQSSSTQVKKIERFLQARR